MAAQGDPTGAGDPGGLVSLVGWAAQRLGAPHLVDPTLRAMQLAGLDPTSPRHDFCWECHHDGTQQVDVSVFTPDRRPDSVAGPALTVHEFDLLAGEPRLAGTFARPAPWRPPGWGEPLQVAEMTGRGGMLRVILGVPDATELHRLRDQLGAAGAGGHVLAALARTEPLLTTPDTARLAIELDPASMALGARIGLEVFLDPALFDIDPALAALGVTAEALQEMTEMAEGVPGGRRLARSLPQLPGVRLDDLSQGVGFSHFKIIWPSTAGGPALLKSYFLVSSGPAPGTEQLRDAAVLRASPTWPQRLRWAGRQLPLRHPSPAELAGLRQWRQEVDPQARLVAWQTRLELDGLDERRVLVAVSDRAGPRVLATPPWWRWYQIIVAAVPAGPAWASPPGLPDAAAAAVPFAHLLWPASLAAWQQFAADQPLLAGGLDANAQQDLQLALLSRLSTVCTPALLHLMWESVPYGQRLLATLGLATGAQPAAAPGNTRYRQLCAELAADGMSNLLTRFPVLGGLLGRAAASWHDALVEMLSRLSQDRGVLADALGIPAEPPVSGVIMAAGDTHNGGRTVAILEIGETRLVYKPRPVALESLYYNVVQALRQQPGQRPLRAGRTVARSDGAGPYGYMEFVAGAPTQDAAQVASFYRNSGRTLAVLHALSATDCHHENLIEAGDQLVLIDAETLLSGPSDGFAQFEGDAPDGGFDQDGRSLPANVLRIGLLPTWLWLDGRRKAVDISALGVSPQWRSGTGHGLRAINTDAMIRGARLTEPPQERAAPPDTGQASGREQLRAHLADFVAGFTDAHVELAAGVSSWLGSAVGHGAPATRRAVLRPTYVYASLLGSSLEPDALTSPAARGLVLERLTRAHLDSPDHLAWPIVAAEQQALAGLDIPYFEVRLAGGATTWLGGSLAGWPPAAPGWSAQAELDRLGQADLDLQLRIIRSAVAVSSVRFGPGATDSTSLIDESRASPGDPGALQPAGVARAAIPGLPLAPPPLAGRSAQRGVEARIHRQERPGNLTARLTQSDPPSPQAAALACMDLVINAALPVPGSTRAPAFAWLGAVMLPDGVRANLADIGLGLYDGRLGLAIALYEWAATGASGHHQAGPHEQEVRQYAEAALAPILQGLAEHGGRAPRMATALGLGMAGVGGMLRGLAHLRTRGHIPEESARRAEQALLDGLSPQAIAAARTLDHIGGVAGLIGPLVALGAGEPKVAGLIRAAAQRLLAAQDPNTGGWWTLPGTAPLTGLAHGAAGISLALARAGVALDQGEFIDAALRGVRYEQATFEAEVGNWPDFRVTGNPANATIAHDRFMMGWCAGAPGIALTRLALLELLPEHPEAPAWRQQLHAAAATTASAPLLTRDHLCCGNLGRVVVLRRLRYRDADPEWHQTASNIVSAVLARPGQEMPRSVLGTDPAGLAMPGLMTGLPGIALALLDQDSNWVSQLLT